MTDLRTLPDLAAIFAHFAATITRPVTDQLMGVTPEDLDPYQTREILKQEIEKGSI